MRGGYRDVPVLVLGAAGFIGRWVARALTEAGARLHLAVRDNARASALLRSYAVRGELHPIDLERVESVRQLIDGQRPVVTFNLAGYGIDRQERDPSTAARINADLVGTVAAAVREVTASSWDGCHLVHVGSALEYGDCRGDLAEATPARPTTLYGRTKLQGTRRLEEICRDGSLRGCTARLFTVYGPGERPGRLLPTLLAAARGEAPIELSAGRQRRDFSYVEDVADGLLRLGTAAARPGEVVNLARGELTTVRRFAEIAAGVLSIDPGRLRFGAIAGLPEEMAHEPVNITRLRELTGWRPPRDITAGVAATRDFG
ncbi:MAG TPA: NAD-dependent epimerase/dehydratase family protein [Candidatus Polarisedimenticolia bacterium]|nr:NAD-dependent epimerase/dehydratase family protein [Candidatus Polarisedimenticolia bacterium]